MPEEKSQRIFMLLTFPNGRVAARGTISRNGKLGWLELESFKLDDPNFGGLRGGGRSATRLVMKSFFTTRGVDNATADLGLLSARGDTLAAIVEFVNGDGKVATRLTFEKVFVSSTAVSGQDFGAPTETAAYDFEKLIFS